MATLKEIAALVGAQDEVTDAEVTCVSSIDSATPLAIVFANDVANLVAAAGSNAGAILTRKSLREHAADSATALDSRILFVDDPRYSFAQAAQFLKSRSSRVQDEAPRIHPTATLGAGVHPGQGTSIGPHCAVEDGVLIGQRCAIAANVTIHSGTTLGDGVIVQAGAVLGATGFGYARSPATGEYIAFPQQGTLLIGDNVEIGANTTIDRGALGETWIGAGTKIDNLVHIAHNCVIGRNVVIAAQTGISGSSVIEDGAILGGQVGLGEHAHIGPGVILGGGAGVLSHKKVRGPGQVFWGRPARPLKQYLRDLARLGRR